MPRCLRPSWNKVCASRIGYRLVHGAFWSTMGAGTSQALVLITSIIAARLLGREQFGQYGIVMTTVGLFTVFTGFGLGTTATKFVAEYKYTDPARAGRTIALSALVALATGTAASLILLFIAPLLAEKALAAPQLSGMLRLATGIIFFSAVNSALIGALAGFEAFRALARINIINGVVSFCLVAGGVYIWDFPGALAGQVTAMGIACIVAFFALKSEAHSFNVSLDYRGCGAEKGVLIGFSLPAIMSGIMVTPVNWACSAILVNQPNGYMEMGLFNAANSWQKAILFLPGCIGAITLPMLSALHGTNDRKEYKKALWFNMLINGCAALLVFLFVAASSKMIMTSYGAAFEEGTFVLVLLSLSALLIAVGSVVGNALASTGRMWLGFVFNSIWAVIYLLLAFYLVPKKGAMGLAIANLVAYILHTIIQSAYAFAVRSR